MDNDRVRSDGSKMKENKLEDKYRLIKILLMNNNITFASTKVSKQLQFQVIGC